MYGHLNVGEILSQGGCDEIEIINCTYRIKGKGDVDFVAYRDDTLIIVETKTLLIHRVQKLLKRHNQPHSRINLFIQYHLEEPLAALGAWKILEELKLTCTESPASIAELVRCVVGARIISKISNYYEKAKRIVIAVAVMFYWDNYLHDVLEYTQRSVEYLQKCLKDRRIQGPVILKISPTSCQYFEQFTPPNELEIRCISKREICNQIDMPNYKVLRNIFAECTKMYLGCHSCEYRSKCMSSYQC